MGYRGPAALVVAICLLLPPLPLRAASSDPGLRRKVELLGAGANVKLKLSDGKKLRGQVAAIEQDAIVVAAPGHSAGRRIAFDQVAQLRPSDSSYKAAGSQDPTAARRAVVGLGVGHHVMVRLETDRIVRGHIAGVEHEHFVLHPDGGAEPVQISYDQVHHVRKNPATSTIIIIASAAAVATVLLVMLAIRESNE